MRRMTGCPECFPKAGNITSSCHFFFPLVSRWGKDGVKVNKGGSANTHHWRCRVSLPFVRRCKIDNSPEKTQVANTLDEPGCAVIMKSGMLDYRQTH